MPPLRRELAAPLSRLDVDRADPDAVAGSVVAEFIGAPALSRAVSDLILERSRKGVLDRMALRPATP